MHLSSVVVFHTCSFYHLVFSSLLFYFFSVFVFLYKNVYVRARVCVYLFLSVCIFFFTYFPLTLFFISTFIYCVVQLFRCISWCDLIARPYQKSHKQIHCGLSTCLPRRVYIMDKWIGNRGNGKRNERKTDKTKYIFLCVYRHSGCSCVPSSSPILFFYSIPFRSIL